MTAKKFSEFTPYRKLEDLDSLKLYKENPCQFIEEQIVIGRNAVNPTLNNTLIKLEPFQKEFIDAVLGTRDTNGYLYYDEAFLGVAKKNAKSSLASIIAIYLFIMEKEDAEFVFSSNSKDQSSILAYGSFMRICRNSPNIKPCVDIHKGGVQKKVRDDRYEIKAFPVPYTEAANHGLENLRFVHYDEAWGYEDDSLYTAFVKNLTKKEFLALTTSYAGFDKRSIFHQQYDRGMKGLSPRMYFKNYSAKEDSPEYWKDANPASWITIEDLASQRPKMLEPQFQRMCLNMWVGTDGSTKLQQFVTEEQIMAITNSDLAPTELGDPTKSYVCGVDLGVIHDNTASAVAHLEGNKIILDRLDVWQPTKEKPIDIEEIEKKMMEIRARYRSLFIIDPAQMENTIQKFAKLYGNHVVKRFNFRGIYNELTELMCKVIKAKELQIYPDAGLYYDSKGNRNTLQTEMVALYIKHLGDSIRFDHDSRGKKDMTDAIAMCVYELVMRPVQYEVRIRDPLGDLARERAEAGLGSFN